MDCQLGKDDMHRIAAGRESSRSGARMLANGVKRGEHHCVMASSQQLLSGELNVLLDGNMDRLTASYGSPFGHRLRQCALRHPASAVGFACNEAAGAPE
jgi:hypothetical protein